MNGRVALPLVLGAVILTAGSELERMAVKPPAAPELADTLAGAALGGETIVWKTHQQLALAPPEPSPAPSPLLARAQGKEKMPKVTSKAGKCKLRRRSRACRKRAGS